MPSLTRPGRLLLAVLLASVVAADIVLLDSSTTAVVLLAGLLGVVLAVGSFSPVAESSAFLLALLGTQVVVVAVLAYSGRYVLALILSVASLATVQRLRGQNS
ncbi:hypothetical protein [Halorussus litoreus]|uniref:hypothetical protein n=1 Tax=Halorussus litoreus TaxID=1710536 RepID=UPI000E273FB5|nr:hypothetical protein [Halorussus litoreus]